MSVLVEFTITPVGQQESIGDYVARCAEIVDRSGIDYELHAMGTIMESDDWNEPFGVIRECYDALKEDCNRVDFTIKVDARAKDSNRLRDKAKSMQDRTDREITI